jgi:hypothetical protein
VFVYFLRKRRGDHFLDNMVRGDMERLGKLVGDPCYNWCCGMENG